MNAEYDRAWVERRKALDETTLDLTQQRDVLITYLNMKAHTEDWHGVMDAACDLREIDAELRGMRR